MGKRKSSPRLATTPTIVMLLLHIMTIIILIIQKQHSFLLLWNKKIDGRQF
jgi:hypothetical protein